MFALDQVLTSNKHWLCMFIRCRADSFIKRAIDKAAEYLRHNKAKEFQKLKLLVVSLLFTS